jgi:flavin-dependent dehydrogenase
LQIGDVEADFDQPTRARSAHQSEISNLKSQISIQLMDDVLIVGAGPAGAVAATVLARAGVRVRLLDRAAFPRDKLCGDTINPGTLALLRRLGLAAGIEARALPIDGMIVTGAGGVSVVGRYPGEQRGLAIGRRELDALLLDRAVAAGAAFDGFAVRAAIVDGPGAWPVVRGVSGSADGRHQLRARVVIAADGRRSTLAFGLRLARHPPRPKRWAIGAYFEDPFRSTFGEMHIRRGRYIGVAPLGGGVSNVCLVLPWSGSDCDFRDPPGLLRNAIAAEPCLRDRFGGRPPVRQPIMLGPLAVDVVRNDIEGLLLAGDAAGFIDPMTGDGLRFAVRGGELAAAAALDALQQGWSGVHARLDAARHREFASKWRFNRALRTLVASRAGVRAASAGARLAPGIVRRLIVRAGDGQAA